MARSMARPSKTCSLLALLNVITEACPFLELWVLWWVPLGSPPPSIWPGWGASSWLLVSVRKGARLQVLRHCSAVAREGACYPAPRGRSWEQDPTWPGCARRPGPSVRRSETYSTDLRPLRIAALPLPSQVIEGWYTRDRPALKTCGRGHASVRSRSTTSSALVDLTSVGHSKDMTRKRGPKAPLPDYLALTTREHRVRFPSRVPHPGAGP